MDINFICSFYSIWFQRREKFSSKTDSQNRLQIICNLTSFNHEPKVVADTVGLLVALADTKEKSAFSKDNFLYLMALVVATGLPDFT
jgi:hypothetical protein